MPPRASARDASVAAVLSLSLMLIGCAHDEVARADLEAVVRRDAIVLDTSPEPERLLSRLSSSRVVVCGELHGNHDHYRLMERLVTDLHAHGTRQLLLEWPHAWDWELVAAVEEGYVPGWEERNPRIGGALVDAVCRLNLDLPRTERIHIRAIDSNHEGYGGSDDFLGALDALAESMPAADVLRSFVASSRAQNADGRIEALKRLDEDLARNREAYSTLWGGIRLGQIAEMVEIELASTAIRQEGLATDIGIRLREEVMKELADRRIAEASGKTIINVGLNHSQKSHLLGTRQEWLADYLAHRSHVTAGSVQSVAIVPARGQVFVVGSLANVDIAASSPDDEVLRVLGDVSGWRTAFLPLDDPLFSVRGVPLNVLSGVHVCAPAEHFDSLILLESAHPIISR